MATVYFGLGSNLGDRLRNLRAARQAIAALPRTRDVRRAGVYETAPVGGPSGQGDFLNTALAAETDLSPEEMIRETLRIEKEIGRVRDRESVRWGPRLIDIDILLWDDVTFERVGGDGPDLVLPHPRLAERAFVLLPLAELAPDAVHPVAGLTIRELAERIGKDNEGIRRLPF